MKNTSIAMAPIRGVTGYVLRNIFCTHFAGISETLAPFITTPATKNWRPSEMTDILPENNTVVKTVPQILSNNADAFLYLARELFKLGHETVNWNIGCPHPVITGKRRGSAILTDVALIDSFLHTVCSEAPGRISVKMRLGLESQTDYRQVIPVLNRYPLAEVIVHPRTGKQMYKGSVHPEYFAECLHLSTHPLTYNGDINTIEDFRRFAARFPDVNKWMIGRGLLRNPVLAEEICADTAAGSEKYPRIKKFHDELYAAYCAEPNGKSAALGKMKGVWYYLCESFENPHKTLKTVKKATTFPSYEAAVETVFHSV